MGNLVGRDKKKFFKGIVVPTIEGLQKSVPIVRIVCPFVEKYSEQLVDFKKVCTSCVCIFLLSNQY